MQTNVDVLKTISQKIKDFKRDDLLTRINQLLRKNIIYDSMHGKSYTGQQFPDYTPEYKKWKQKKTGFSNVNLTITGEMLNSIIGEIQGTTLTVSTNDNPGKVEGVSAKRPWLGISEPTRKQIMDMIRTEYLQIISTTS